MAIKHGLGRGLDALIRDGSKPAHPQPAAPAHEAPAPGEKSIVKLPVSAIRKNAWQPRHHFDAEALVELTQSIREHGVIQPLLVRASDSGYELIAGERRLRAATEAGLAEVPAIIMKAADKEALELALIENLQRQDLNVIEEAEGYQLLAERFSLSQEQIADRVGKARASIANALRLLDLPAEIKQMVITGQISPGHAKVMAGMESISEQILMAKRVVKENLSVRNLEKIVEHSRKIPKKPRAARADLPPAHVTYLTDKLHSHFGTSIRLAPCKTYANGKKGRGLIEIEYYSNEDLDRILTLMGIQEDTI
jgi:ParB family chromosome partitioning protein